MRDGLSPEEQARALEMLPAERDRARQLYLEGSIRHIWETEVGVALVFEAESHAHLDAIVGSFPLVAADLLETTLLPLRPYGGFGPIGG
jgi:muconolactone delta-isomerase